MANPNYPRLRVSRIATLAMTTSWQKIDFSAGVGDSLNVNTFGNNSSGVPMVTWDTTNKLFKFNHLEDVNYTGFLFNATTTTLITTRATLQMRCVIPNGGGAGIDSYFPFGGQGNYSDIKEVTILAAVQQNNGVEPVPLYANSNIRTNGFWIELRLSNSLITLGTCTLNYAAFLIQSTGK